MRISQGYFIAVAAAIVGATWDVFSRISIEHFQANPAVYACVSMFTASFVLIILAGPGRGGLETTKSMHTWLFAIFQVLMAATEAYSFLFVTATEFNLFLRGSALISLALSFLILGRVPKQRDYIAAMIVLAGLLILAFTFPPETRVPAIVMISLSAFFFSLRSLITEIHPVSNKTLNMKDQFRVVGYTLFVTSLAFTIGYAALGLVFDQLNPENNLPSLNDFVGVPGIICALVSGIFFVSTFFVLNFIATKSIKNESYIFVEAISPIIAMGLEFFGAAFVVFVNAETLDVYDVIAAAFIVVGGFYKIFVDIKEENKNVEKFKNPKG